MNNYSPQELENMEEIKNNYGFFLEHIHPLLIAFFLTDIPESFLPYPKQLLENTLEKIEKYYGDRNDMEFAQVIASTRAALLYYCNDEQAVNSLIRKKPEVFKNASIPLLRKMQKNIDA